MRRTGSVYLAGLCAAALATACGAPSYTYVTNADDQLYFKVPTSWQRIDQKALDAVAATGLKPSEAAALKASSWSVAYDSAANPSVTHLLATSAQTPVVYSRVLSVDEDNRGGVTLDSLRNSFLPITENARLQAAANGTALPEADIRTDEVVKQHGLQGVHTVFRFPLGGRVEAFDQTAYRARDGSKIYLLLIRCAQTCYADRYQDELAPVVRSFTVESAS
jgi:hypothetical protein